MIGCVASVREHAARLETEHSTAWNLALLQRYVPAEARLCASPRRLLTYAREPRNSAFTVSSRGAFERRMMTRGVWKHTADMNLVFLFRNFALLRYVPEEARPASFSRFLSTYANQGGINVYTGATSERATVSDGARQGVPDEAPREHACVDTKANERLDERTGGSVQSDPRSVLPVARGFRKPRTTRCHYRSFF